MQLSLMSQISMKITPSLGGTPLNLENQEFPENEDS